MPKRKYNWDELKIKFIKTPGITLKEFIEKNIGKNAFKKNGNYKTYIRNKIKYWTKQKEDYWREFMGDISNFYTNEDLYIYYQGIKKLNEVLPTIIDKYIENLKNKKDISLNEIIKLYNFLKTIADKKETKNIYGDIFGDLQNFKLI